MISIPSHIDQVVLLGHTGFIGNAVATKLKQVVSHIPIHCLSSKDVDLTDSQATQTLANRLTSNTRLIICSGIKRQLGDTLETFQRNIQMAINLGQLLADNPVDKVVHFSSAAVYGEEVHNTDIRETTLVHPMSYYGIAKFTTEGVLQKNVEPSRLLILRPPSVYGPSDASKSYGPARFIDHTLKQETITLWGDGTELREFLFIDDAAKATVDLVFNEARGVLNLVTGTSYSFQQILDEIRQISPHPVLLDQRERTKRKVDNAFDSAALRAALPGLEFTSLRSGIQQSWEVEAQKLASFSSNNTE